MKEYYPVAFDLNDIPHFCIWFSNEYDGFITEKGKIVQFISIDHLFSYARSNNLTVTEDLTVISMKPILKWLEEMNDEIDYSYFLDFWNLVSDLANTLGEEFWGNKKTPRVNAIYDKLFFSNNLPSMAQEPFLPIWSPDEKKELSRVLTDGLRVIDFLFSI